VANLDGSELVLCVRRNVFGARVRGKWTGPWTGLLPFRDHSPESFQEQSFLADLVRAAELRPRTPELESDTSWKQLVPYGLLLSAGRFWAYRRARGSGEGRLLGKHSLGLGGHINLQDLAEPRGHFTPVLALLRELAEEVGLARGDVRSFRLLGLVNDDTNPVGRAHLGLVYAATLGVAGPAAIRPSPEVEPVGWLHPVEAERIDLDFEPWSEILRPYLRKWASGPPSAEGFARVSP
jgi:predicted NUDIX family phosphoesterase